MDGSWKDVSLLRLVGLLALFKQTVVSEVCKNYLGVVNIMYLLFGVQKRVPVFRSMFSELRHHPRYEIRLEAVDPVPKFISRQWRGNQSEARNAVLKIQA